MGLQKVQELKTKMEAVKKEMLSQGKAAVAEAFQEIFDGCAQLEAVKWDQYTPYFNDGEACVFGVHDFYAKFVGVDENGDRDDGFLNSWDLAYYNDDLSHRVADYKDRRKDKHPLTRLFESLAEISALEDVLEDAFGDHVEVTVTRQANGKVSIDADECSHD